MEKPTFIPAARYRPLTPLYDLLCRAVGLGERLRRFQLDRLEGLDPARILEVGCGSGELTRAVARRFPTAELVAIDADPEILAIARRKLEGDGLAARLEVARAQELPFPDGRFDLVLSSLMLHHLPTAGKARAIAEWRRVLAPEGTLLLFDFGPPDGLLARTLLFPLRFDLLEEQADNFRGRVPELLAEAGFETEVVGIYGSTIHAWRARPPGR